MKELKEEAKRHHEAKLEKYGAEHHKACGGSMKRAHGGKVGHEEHPHKERDKHLAGKIEREAKEIEHDHEGKKHGGHVKHHRADGGPIAGGSGGSKLGRGRKGGKGKTSVNIAIGKPGGDSAGAPPMPPPALGAGPGPVMPPPRPMPPPGGPAGAMPPRPGMPPMKYGGHVKKHHGEHEKKHEHKRHHEHRGHSGHRG